MKGMLIELREKTSTDRHVWFPFKVTAPSGPTLRHCTMKGPQVPLHSMHPKLNLWNRIKAATDDSDLIF